MFKLSRRGKPLIPYLLAYISDPIGLNSSTIPAEYQELLIALSGEDLGDAVSDWQQWWASQTP